MQTTHDPPGISGQASPPAVTGGDWALDRPYGDDEVILPRRSADPLTHLSLTTARGDLLRSDKYRLLANALRARGLHDEPLELVVDMAEGRYRMRRRRGGYLYTDRETGRPVTDRMSFRPIRAEMLRLTGIDVSHETYRRWWLQVWPDRSTPADDVPQAVFLAPADGPV